MGGNRRHGGVWPLDGVPGTFGRSVELAFSGGLLDVPRRLAGFFSDARLTRPHSALTHRFYRLDAILLSPS